MKKGLVHGHQNSLHIGCLGLLYYTAPASAELQPSRHSLPSAYAEHVVSIILVRRAAPLGDGRILTWFYYRSYCHGMVSIELSLQEYQHPFQQDALQAAQVLFCFPFFGSSGKI